MSFLDETRLAYDTVAVDYATLLEDNLAQMPFDRLMLDAFAELLPEGVVADLGCGPGRITGYLAEHGLDICGIDLSSGMVTEARRRYPSLTFQVGTLTALDLPTDSLSGALAWYSLIHVPPSSQPLAIAEIARVVAPEGLVLLAFQVGDFRHHLDEGYGHPISLDAYRLDPSRITAMLEDAGVEVIAKLERQAVEREKTPQAYLLGRVRA